MKKEEIKDYLLGKDNEALDVLTKDVAEAEEYFAKRIKNIEEKDL